MNTQPTVAVITPTIGRAHLEFSIKSVLAQHYPCKHYVFVDGQEYVEQAKRILMKYPSVVPIYLPMNTGRDGWCNSRINAIAPFVVEEDIICYLDDDNTYLPHHIESIVHLFQQKKLDFVYSLRNFVDNQGNFICKDHTESVGFLTTHIPDNVVEHIRLNGKQYNLNIQKPPKSQFIDTNCYAFIRQLAIHLADIWMIRGDINDQMIFRHLKNIDCLYECTKQFSVNYQIDVKKVWSGNLFNTLLQTGANQEEVKSVMIQIFKNMNERSILQLK